MGHGEFDDTRQVRKLEQPSLNTTRNLVKEMDSHDLIIDVGDISYADGYEPIVSLMTLITCSLKFILMFVECGLAYYIQFSGVTTITYARCVISFIVCVCSGMSTLTK